MTGEGDTRRYDTMSEVAWKNTLELLHLDEADYNGSVTLSFQVTDPEDEDFAIATQATVQSVGVDAKGKYFNVLITERIRSKPEEFVRLVHQSRPEWASNTIEGLAFGVEVANVLHQLTEGFEILPVPEGNQHLYTHDYDHVPILVFLAPDNF